MNAYVIPASGWLVAIRRYLAVMAAGNLVWEVAQLPLYTLWHEASLGSILWAVLHCTVGDLVIGTVALMAALVAFGSAGWPSERHFAVLATVVAVGAGYTVISEYLNTVVRGSWAYSAAMPTLPWIGTGLAPLAQWLLVPTLALSLARGCARVSRLQAAIPRFLQGE